jgi:hypothetical protein
MKLFALLAVAVAVAVALVWLRLKLPAVRHLRVTGRPRVRPS